MQNKKQEKYEILMLIGIGLVISVGVLLEIGILYPMFQNDILVIVPFEFGLGFYLIGVGGIILSI